MIYVAGRLRDPTVRELANTLREGGFDVFDDWAAAHPDADDKWRDYELDRGRDLAAAMRDSAYRKQVRDFDLAHLRQSEVLVICRMPSHSTSWEMGYAAHACIPVIWFLPEDPERWDFMFQAQIVRTLDELVWTLKEMGCE
jgi:nucleoside 2-deoxyribosyltransferase